MQERHAAPQHRHGVLPLSMERKATSVEPDIFLLRRGMRSRTQCFINFSYSPALCRPWFANLMNSFVGRPLLSRVPEFTTPLGLKQPDNDCFRRSGTGGQAFTSRRGRGTQLRGCPPPFGLPLYAAAPSTPASSAAKMVGVHGLNTHHARGIRSAGRHERGETSHFKAIVANQ